METVRSSCFSESAWVFPKSKSSIEIDAEFRGENVAATLILGETSPLQVRRDEPG
jgi:hypothetical protein